MARTPNTAAPTSPQVWAILVIVLGLLLTGRGVWDMVQVKDRLSWRLARTLGAVARGASSMIPFNPPAQPILPSLPA